MDTGQPINYSATSPGMEPVIRNGALTVDRGTQGGWYAYLDAGEGKTLTRVGIKFRFDGGTTHGGAVNISLTNGPYLKAGGTAYRIGAHLVVTDSGWGLTKVSNASGDLDFQSPHTGQLKLLDGIEYKLELWRKGDTVIIALPDGQAVNISDPDIAAWSGQYGFFEVVLADTSDGLPGITQAWYD